MRRLSTAWAAAMTMAACDASSGSSDTDLQVGAVPADGGVMQDRDTLDVSVEFEEGSFDQLYATIIQPRCAGEPGLCHNGQFPPNLATPAVTYFEIVRSIGQEKPTQLRVAPGDAASSLFVDKLRNRDVASQMPLGAEPLTEAQISAIEAWIDAGALRRPGAEPAADLNLPPSTPEVAVYDPEDNWLDMAGPALVDVGDTVVIRHSVQDFEHPNESTFPFASCSLELEDGFAVVLGTDEEGMPSSDGNTTFDADAPMGITDLLNYQVSWLVTDPVQLVNGQGQTREEPASGLRFNINCVYTDEVRGVSAAGVELGYLRFGSAVGRLGVR